MKLKQTLEYVNKNEFLIEVFGLGYVGFPLAVRLSSNGFKVQGIDVDERRIERLKNNDLTDTELHLENEFVSSRKNNCLQLSNTLSKSTNPKIGIICVPTPIPEGETKSDTYVESAVRNFLDFSKEGDILILESSIEVGTTEKMSEIVKSYNYKISETFGICFCPERIDPANKKWGLENIPRVIYCSDDVSFNIADIIYKQINGGNLVRVNSAKIAEVVKSFENAFRLVNITLVNELAMLCDKLGISVKEVIDAAASKPFGFIPHYAGAGAGGHCIPKDPRFLLESAKKYGSNFDIVEHALKINQFMPKYICNSIEKKLEELKLEKIVLVCGLSYKSNVEDMRDTPGFKIIKEMNEKGFTVYGFDPFFKMKLVEKYLDENHISELNFNVLQNIDNSSIEKINCLCIVQHHDNTEQRIKEIYEKSLIPFVYDCQSILLKNSESKSELNYLGN